MVKCGNSCYYKMRYSLSIKKVTILAVSELLLIGLVILRKDLENSES